MMGLYWLSSQAAEPCTFLVVPRVFHFNFDPLLSARQEGSTWSCLDGSDLRGFVLDASIESQTIRQRQVHTTLHLRLESLQLAHTCFQHSCIIKVFDPDCSVEHVCATRVKELEPGPGWKSGLWGSLNMAQFGLMEDAPKRYDDVVVYQAVSFDVIFFDKSASWSEGAGTVVRGTRTYLALRQP